ncbi:chemotaxis protein CheW [Massilia sp.]|uniref:chemotaxis protein CheW n=1 Tax=Massilia sp. TaxID=1882437 RepID=UPI00289B9A0D|nr:chemotaxis protein CheW [Massilia sp.]
MSVDAGGAASTRRSRLRAYQEQLLEKMQAAKNGAGASVAQLGLGIGGARYLVDLAEVGEIVAPPPLTAVPLTQPWYLGLANVRGNLLGVIDLAAYLGAPAASGEHAGAPRLAVFAPMLGFNCALLASQVYGLRQAGAMERDGDLLRDAEGNAWTPLSLAALVQEPRFLHVAR